MKISYNWLKDHIAVNETPERIAEILTSIGLEVESIEHIEAVKGGLRGILVGDVLECIQHPDADKLHITKVNIGCDEILQIVCGAPNIAVGQKVPVATIGTTLYFANGNEVKIKKSKLRGIESHGMICAEDEIGISACHDGIMILQPDAIPGTPLSELLSLESDTIFEIGLTPNRIDAASHTGVARDLAAYLKINLQSAKLANIKIGDGNKLNSSNGGFIIPSICQPEACLRYTGITIRNIVVKPSPEWLQKRLTSINVRPINNIVDITNYVLHDTGQPLHAFDADTIEGGRVIVKTCVEDVKFVTLDGVERILNARDLMICSASKPMCIAGVFGGQEHGVTSKTVNIFLESACFNPVWIRKTARRHGLNTDASFRYERGSDPQITPFALKRAVALILEIAGGEIAGEIIDLYPNPVMPAKVWIEYGEIEKLTGKSIEKEIIIDILRRLDFTIDNENAEGLHLTVPTYRIDVTRPADVIEEILRIYGYNNIEIPSKTTITIANSQYIDKEKIQNTISEYLAANGFFEMMNNSLTKSDYYQPLQTFPQTKTVRIINPLSNDLDAMRQTLLFGGLESVSCNINHRNISLKLFEWGNCYTFNAEKNDGTLRSYLETLRLALFITGPNAPQSWNKPQEYTNFFHTKGYVENIFARFGINTYCLETEDAPKDLFFDGIQYLMHGKKIAVLGIVSKKIRSIFDIKQDVFVAEISGNILFDILKNHKILYKELPKFPDVRRDLALVIDEKVTYAQLRETAFKTEKNLLTHVNLFDVYHGDKLPHGKKQYAVSFILQDREKTLTDQNIERIMANLLKAFEQNFDASLR